MGKANICGCGGNSMADVPPLLLNSHQMEDLMSSTAGATTVPVLALAFAGHYTQQHVQSLLGPSDPLLAKHTDPQSLHALFGTRRHQVLFCGSHTKGTAFQDVARFFGPHIQTPASLARSVDPQTHKTQPKKQSLCWRRARHHALFVP